MSGLEEEAEAPGNEGAGIAHEVVGEETFENPQAGTARSSGSVAAGREDEPVSQPEDALPSVRDLADAAGVLATDTADVRATLTDVASGLAEQLCSITEEMNKIRAELCGQSGLGGIAMELERLKAGGLGGLGALGGAGLEDVLGGEAPGRRPGAGEHQGAVRRSAGAVGSASGEARSRRSPEDRERELEELRRRLVDRRTARQAAETPGVSVLEKLVLLAIVMVCLYIGSPFFRTSVQKVFASLVFGTEEGSEDFYAED